MSLQIKLVLGVLLLAWCWLPVAAQDTVTGAFEGTVTDSQTGEPIASAQAVIVNRETGLTINKTASARGRFYQGLLAPGLYAIRVSAPGYATREVEQRLLVSRTGEVVPVPVALDPATATTTPTPAAPLRAQDTQVRAETNLVDAQRTGSFPDGTVDALPIGGTTITRSFDELTLLLPGVTMPPPAVGNGSGPGQGPGVGSAGQFAINGLRSRGNNFTVDGSDNNDEDIGVRRQGFLSLVPQSIESIREYQVTTLLPNAVFGRNLGAQVNAVSRSGGKDFHGNLYGFFNSSQLNARNFFDTANGNATTPLRVGNQPVVVSSSVAYNTATLKFVPVNGQAVTTTNGSGGEDSFTFGQGGFVLGGPLRRDRAFFFVSYEHQVINASQEANFAVPTVTQRGIRNSGASSLFRNPFTNTPARNFPATAQGNGIFSLFPFPNNPGGVYGDNTFTQTLPADGNGSIVSGKYDQNFTRSGRQQSITARYNFTQDRRILPTTGGALFSTLQPRVRTQNFSFFANSQVNAPDAATQVLNQLRLSYGRTRLLFDEIFDPSGFMQRSSSFPDTPFLLNARLLENFTLPDLAASGDGVLPNSGPIVLRQTPGNTTERAVFGSTLGFLLGPVGQVIIGGFSPVGVDVFNFPQRRVNNTYQLADNLTARTGNHTFVFGYDGRRSELNSDLPRNFRPLITFNGAPEARLPFAGAPLGFTGNFTSPLDLAAIAAPSGVQQTLTTGSDAALNLRFYQHNIFFQDDWRIQRNLSLSLGLRYEYNSPVSDARQRVESSFNDPNVSLVPGLATFNAGREKAFDADFNNFAPRLGLAYAPHPKLVVRVGYGIYYDQILGAVVSQSRNVFPRFVNVNTAGGIEAVTTTGMMRGLTRLGIVNPATNTTLVQGGTLNRLAPGVTLAQQIQTINFIANSGGALANASGIEFTLPARNLPTPFSHQISSGLEHQITPNLALSATFTATRGDSLLRFTTPNLGPGAALLPVVLGVQQTPTLLDFGPQVFGVALPPGARPGANGFQGARPQPNVGGASIFQTNGSSFYRSLQLQARGRLAQSFQFQAAYTLGRVVDDVSDVFDLAGAFALPQNSINFAGERAPANFDARHRFAYYFIYDVPAKNVLLKDLQLSGTGQFQTGAPFTVNSVFDVNLDGNLTDRLNTTQGLVAGADRRETLRLTVNPNTLLAPVGQDGSVSRNSFRASNLLDLNLALTKGFRFTERQRAVVRVELFNFINRANFGIPVRFLEFPSFGSAVNTLTPARRVQFVLRYIF